MLDLDHPFFRPLIRRVVIATIVLGWAVFEFVVGSPVFGFLFAALGAWCCWSFFGPNSAETYKQKSD